MPDEMKEGISPIEQGAVDRAVSEVKHQGFAGRVRSGEMTWEQVERSIMENPVRGGSGLDGTPAVTLEGGLSPDEVRRQAEAGMRIPEMADFGYAIAGTIDPEKIRLEAARRVFSVVKSMRLPDTYSVQAMLRALDSKIEDLREARTNKEAAKRHGLDRHGLVAGTEPRLQKDDMFDGHMIVLSDVEAGELARLAGGLGQAPLVEEGAPPQPPNLEAILSALGLTEEPVVKETVEKDSRGNEVKKYVAQITQGDLRRLWANKAVRKFLETPRAKEPLYSDADIEDLEKQISKIREHVNSEIQVLVTSYYYWYNNRNSPNKLLEIDAWTETSAIDYRNMLELLATDKEGSGTGELIERDLRLTTIIAMAGKWKRIDDVLKEKPELAPLERPTPWETIAQRRWRDIQTNPRRRQDKEDLKDVGITKRWQFMLSELLRVQPAEYRKALGIVLVEPPGNTFVFVDFSKLKGDFVEQIQIEKTPFNHPEGNINGKGGAREKVRKIILDVPDAEGEEVTEERKKADEIDVLRADEAAFRLFQTWGLGGWADLELGRSQWGLPILTSSHWAKRMHWWTTQEYDQSRGKPCAAPITIREETLFESHPDAVKLPLEVLWAPFLHMIHFKSEWKNIPASELEEVKKKGWEWETIPASKIEEFKGEGEKWEPIPSSAMARLKEREGEWKNIPASELVYFKREVKWEAIHLSQVDENTRTAWELWMYGGVKLRELISEKVSVFSSWHEPDLYQSKKGIGVVDALEDPLPGREMTAELASQIEASLLKGLTPVNVTQGEMGPWWELNKEGLGEDLKKEHKEDLEGAEGWGKVWSDFPELRKRRRAHLTKPNKKKKWEFGRQILEPLRRREAEKIIAGALNFAYRKGRFRGAIEDWGFYVPLWSSLTKQADLTRADIRFAIAESGLLGDYDASQERLDHISEDVAEFMGFDGFFVKGKK
ncbi:MAG: hypothetical protein Q7S60_03580 [bacterium]|nr:hypothetical protein [bacterium]